MVASTMMARVGVAGNVTGLGCEAALLLWALWQLFGVGSQ